MFLQPSRLDLPVGKPGRSGFNSRAKTRGEIPLTFIWYCMVAQVVRSATRFPQQLGMKCAAGVRPALAQSPRSQSRTFLSSPAGAALQNTVSPGETNKPCALAGTLGRPANDYLPSLIRFQNQSPQQTVRIIPCSAGAIFARSTHSRFQDLAPAGSVGKFFKSRREFAQGAIKIDKTQTMSASLDTGSELVLTQPRHGIGS